MYMSCQTLSDTVFTRDRVKSIGAIHWIPITHRSSWMVEPCKRVRSVSHTFSLALSLLVVVQRDW